MLRLIQLLRRSTSSGLYLAEVDGLRFLSILFVLICHFASVLVLSGWATESSLTYRVLENGANGVRIFFCISGYILAYPLLKPGGAEDFHLGRYFLRRASRLEPPYIVSCVGMAALWFLLGKDFLSNLLPTILYVHSIMYKYPSPINPVTWSLEVEVQYYLLFPLIYFSFVYLKKYNIALAHLFLGSLFVIGLICQYTPPTSFKTLPEFLHFFVAGFYVAYSGPAVARKMPSGLPSRLVTLLLLGMTAELFVLDIRDHSVVLSAGYCMFLYCAFVLVLHFKSSFRTFLTSGIVSVTGGMCYTIYLYHVIIMTAVVRLLSFFRPGMVGLRSAIICAVFYFPFVWMVSAILYIIFEKPFMLKGWYRNGKLVAYYGQIWSIASGKTSVPEARGVSFERN